MPIDLSPFDSSRTIAYGFSGCRPDGNYDVVEFSVPLSDRCDDSTCVQHFYRSNYECFPTEFPDLFLHVECHLPSVIHKVISVSGLTQSTADNMEIAFCGSDSVRCANFAANMTTAKISFDYLGQGISAFRRRRRTTNPCDEDLFSVPNATATMLACCQEVGADCTDFQLTANFTGTPEFPSVGSSDFVACGTDADCPTELSSCVDNACVAAAGHDPTSTDAPTTAAPATTTSTTTTPLPPEEAFPGAFYGTVGAAAGIQAAAILAEVVAEVVATAAAGTGAGGVSVAGSLMESFL
jgi:hypothetical protein